MGSLALALACATADELHQSTVPSRTGSFGDVLVDMTGASLGILLFCLFMTRPTGNDGIGATSILS
jgi:VanZ family protein